VRGARTAGRSWNRRLARLIAYGVSQSFPHGRLGDAPNLNADKIPDRRLVLTQQAREVVAGSVAGAICSQFGLDLSLRFVDYVPGWGTRRVMTRRRSAWAWPRRHP
jgi:hypothetical protein